MTASKEQIDLDAYIDFMIEQHNKIKGEIMHKLSFNAGMLVGFLIGLDVAICIYVFLFL